jgi:hypothetical protein
MGVYEVARPLFMPVILVVGFGGLCGVVGGVRVMRVRHVCVMRRPFMMVGLVMFGCFAVMAGGVLVVFGSLDMVLCGLLGHVIILP